MRIGGGCADDPNMSCANLEVSAWNDVRISAGPNQFTIYDDDGQGCVNARYAFVVTP